MPKVTTLRDIIRELRLDANELFQDNVIGNEKFVELESIMSQLNEKEQGLLLDFARLLVRYSEEE